MVTISREMYSRPEPRSPTLRISRLL